MLEKRKVARESNIEILRIIAMCMITLHHFVLNTGITEGTEISRKMIYGIFCGVSGKIGVGLFVIITGYFLVDSKFSFKRILKLWFQVFFYSVAIYVIFYFLGRTDWMQKKDIIKIFMPIGYNQYWFITTYMYLMLIAPLINKLIESLNKEGYKKVLILLTIILVIVPTVLYNNNMIGNTTTPITLIIFSYLYMLAGYMKKYEIYFFKNHFARNILIFILGYIMSMLLSIIGKKIGDPYYLDMFSYYRELNSLPIVLCYVSLFYIFKDWKFKSNAVINGIAKVSLPVYLIQENNFVREPIWKEIFYILETDGRMKILLTGIIAIVVLYSISIIVELFRVNLLEKPIMKMKSINKLSEKVDNFYNEI